MGCRGVFSMVAPSAVSPAVTRLTPPRDACPLVSGLPQPPLTPLTLPPAPPGVEEPLEPHGCGGQGILCAHSLHGWGDRRGDG